MAHRRAAPLFTALTLVWSVALLFLCLADAPPELEGPLGWDKLQHAGAFGLLALFVSAACRGNGKPPFLSAMAGFAYATLFGGAVEILQQTLTRSRQADPFDFASDAIGALCAVLILHLRVRDRNFP